PSRRRISAIVSVLRRTCRNNPGSRCPSWRGCPRPPRGRIATRQRGGTRREAYGRGVQTRVAPALCGGFYPAATEKYLPNAARLRCSKLCRREFLIHWPHQHRAPGGGVRRWDFTLPTRAQQGERVRRIGSLMNLAAEDPVSIARKAFGQGLQSLGWIEGRTVHVDYRWAAGTADLFHRYATEFAASLPDIMVASGGGALPAVLQATRTIPIVFVIVPDPVGNGYVASLSRPGGNATGFLVFE